MKLFVPKNPMQNYSLYRLWFFTWFPFRIHTPWNDLVVYSIELKLLRLLVHKRSSNSLLETIIYWRHVCTCTYINRCEGNCNYSYNWVEVLQKLLAYQYLHSQFQRSHHSSSVKWIYMRTQSVIDCRYILHILHSELFWILIAGGNSWPATK